MFLCIMYYVNVMYVILFSVYVILCNAIVDDCIIYINRLKIILN